MLPQVDDTVLAGPWMDASHLCMHSPKVSQGLLLERPFRSERDIFCFLGWCWLNLYEVAV